MSKQGVLAPVHSSTKTLILLQLALLAVAPARAQTLESGFSPPLLWERLTPYTLSAGPVRGFADGRGGVLLVGNGGADVMDGQWLREPIRVFEAGGRADASFVSAVSGGWATAVQPDGKILLTSDTEGATVIYRLLASGALDPGFIPVGFSQGIRHLAVLPGGKILAVVWGNAVANPSAWAIPAPNSTVVRLHANGRVDTSFRRPEFQGFGFLYAPPAVDGAGRIHIGGRFTSANGVARANVVRLLPNGEVDESFAGSSGIPGGLGGTVRGVEILRNGSVLVAGDLRIPATASSRDRIAILRFGPGGHLDETFTPRRIVDLGLVDYPRATLLQPDDKLIAVSAWIRRFNPDGTLDAEFAGADFPAAAFWLTRMSDGRLLVPGANSSEGLAVFSANGTPDLSFRAGGFGRATLPETLVVLGNGRLAVAGPFNRVGSRTQLGLALLDPVTGEPSSPQPDIAQALPDQAVLSYANWPAQVAVGPNDTLWFLAEAMDTNFVARRFFGRTLGSGALDPTFPIQEIEAPNPLALATALSPLPDGRLWVLANSAQAAVDGTHVLRLRPEGTIDGSFGGLDPAVRFRLARVTYMPDQSIERIELGHLRVLGPWSSGQLLASVNTIDGEAQLIRMDEDGRLDQGFAGPVVTGLGSTQDFPEVFNPLTGLREQPLNGALVFGERVFEEAVALPDGKTLVAGRFYELAGVPVPHLARLNQDGSVDPQFAGLRLDYAASPFVEPAVHAVQADARGRVYLAGAFDHVNLRPAPGLVRLLPDGSVDDTFQSPVQFMHSPPSRAALRLIGDSLYVFGRFTDGQSQRLIWRLRVEEELTLSFPLNVGSAWTLAVPASPTEATVLQASENLADWQDVFTNAPGAPPTVFTDSEASTKPRRFYRLKR